ncbi:MAG: AAA family ATPase, partial [Eubacterium sp.]
DFKNTIIILTSNLGSSYLLEGIGADGEISQQAKDEIDHLLKASFRPEFLNRLDEIVLYKPLAKSEIGSIVDLMLKSLATRLAAKQLHLEVSDEAKDFIIENGYDPIYGARPLKRFIQNRVETLIARAILSGDPAPDATLRVGVENGSLTVSVGT